MFTRKPEVEAARRLPKGGVDDFPLPVVSDWGKQVRRAIGVCHLIDENLDDSDHRPLAGQEEPPPWWWSPKRRVRMITDIYAAIHGRR